MLLNSFGLFCGTGVYKDAKGGLVLRLHYSGKAFTGVSSTLRCRIVSQREGRHGAYWVLFFSGMVLHYSEETFTRVYLFSGTICYGRGNRLHWEYFLSSQAD